MHNNTGFSIPYFTQNLTLFEEEEVILVIEKKPSRKQTDTG